LSGRKFDVQRDFKESGRVNDSLNLRARAQRNRTACSTLIKLLTPSDGRFTVRDILLSKIEGSLSSAGEDSANQDSSGIIGIANDGGAPDPQPRIGILG
jgi:hypothetical protein